MQIRKENDVVRLGICHRLFNFIMNSLIGRGLKRVSFGGHPHMAMPTSHEEAAAVGECAVAGSGVQEPLIISNAKTNGGDESDSTVQIYFKQTDHELENWTPIDKLGSSVHVTDDRKTEKTNKMLNGKGEGSKGAKIIIPITDSAGKKEQKKKGSHKFPSPKLPTTQLDSSTPMLTGLGLNINEISEKYIQNTKERMIRNISLMEREEN